MHLSHTLVHHYESDDSAVVAVLLLSVPGEADVFPLVFKCDVPQQDGDVVLLRGADKVHAIMVNTDPGLHALHGDRCVT